MTRLQLLVLGLAGSFAIVLGLLVRLATVSPWIIFVLGLAGIALGALYDLARHLRRR